MLQYFKNENTFNTQNGNVCLCVGEWEQVKVLWVRKTKKKKKGLFHIENQTIQN